MRSHRVHLLLRRLLSLASLVILVLSGCSFKIPGLSQPTSTPVLPSGPTGTPQPLAAITFSVALPTPLLADEVLFLSVVDEVTGIGLNPLNYAMQGMDTLHYTVTVPFSLNSLVKYRYLRQGRIPILEDTSADKAVRYRLYHVTSPATVNDVVSAWSDGLFNSPSGQVTGQILDSSSHAGVPGLLIAAGGQQTLTDSSGNFSLENLPVGTHNLVAYAMDGAYQTFQQGATVAAGQSTQVDLLLDPTKLVNVVFTVTVPGSTIQNLPIRLAGSLYQLGDTFADLQGGLSMVATRMPLLSPMPDGRYTITLSLPVGADIRYKYTLGDGFWNAEHSIDGSFMLRQLIVPDSTTPVQVQDVISTWQSGTASPILFELNVPASTPVSDIVSIQFNPYGWTEPIPMWPRGNNQWVYQLYSPLNMLGDFEYRYCRNDQCGVADDSATAAGQPGRTVSTSLVPQDLQDSVTSWSWFQPGNPPALTGLPVTQRPATFWSGVAFLPSGDPTWQAWTPLAIQDVKSHYASWLVLSPTWSVSRSSPLDFSPVPGTDAVWNDQLDTISHARAAALSVALFPEVNLPADTTAWWQSAPRDQAWWETWFKRYSAFADYHADLATKAGAQALILGGAWLAPALPDGQLNGNPSGVPADAGSRWSALLADVRSRFGGQLLWATAYPGDLASLPAFAKDLDGIYLLWNAPLDGSSVDDLKASAGTLLDSTIQPFQAALGKPVILAAAYPSVNGAGNVSLPDQQLFQPGAAMGGLNLQAQEDVYQALFIAVNERGWLGGFVSRGYYPPAALQDGSASVHGKPAEDVLWYWFGRFTGAVK
jgi:hypothetical protein